MGVKVPVMKSEYLNLGNGPTIEKVKEIANLYSFVHDFKAEEIQIEIHQNDNTLVQPLTYFNPDNIENPSRVVMIDNLFYTMELNPPEQVFVTRPDGVTIHLIEGEEINEVLEECYDVTDKLRDCIDTMRSGNQLDSTQESFLRAHNIIE